MAWILILGIALGIMIFIIVETGAARERREERRRRDAS